MRPLILSGCILALALIALLAQATVRPGAALATPARVEARIQTWRAEGWTRTDFSRRAVDLSEIVSGGPPRDGIPPIDAPRFVAAAAASWLDPSEPVLVVQRGDEARAYPLQILIWHEIVNDDLGGMPVAVTFCPLCNSALVFERTLAAAGGPAVLDFGTTGKLRHSDLVMWDRQSESWWQQLTGEAIVGRHTGARLRLLPAPLVSFETFRRAFPRGRVLSRDTGHARPYGRNPYVAYDRPGNAPFLLKGRPDGRLPPMERVVALELGGEARAYSYARLAELGVVHDTLGGVPLAIFHRAGTRSALDGAEIADSRDVGAAAVFVAERSGRRLTFEQVPEGFRDRETGSRWNLLGMAVEGTLKGERLKPVAHANPFAFAWFAFRPESGLWAPNDP